MVYLILILLAVWLALTIIGLIFKGLLWLGIIGAVLFLATVVWGWIQGRQNAA